MRRKCGTSIIFVGWHVTVRFAKKRMVVECADQFWTACFLEGKMVAANSLITDHGAMINIGRPKTISKERISGFIGDITNLQRGLLSQ